MADLGLIRRLTAALTNSYANIDPNTRFAPTMDMTGALVVMNFVQKAILDGKAYQVRAGTVTTPLTGDGTALTDAAAEMCADAATGLTILPYYAALSIDVWTADNSEGAIKSVGAVSSAGTAFVPLPLKQGGAAASSTARVAGTGGVTVTAELATTTRRYLHWTAEEGGTPATDVSLHTNPIIWDAAMRAPRLDGPACFYLQESLATYFANFEYIELATAILDGSA